MNRAGKHGKTMENAKGNGQRVTAKEGECCGSSINKTRRTRGIHGHINKAQDIHKIDIKARWRVEPVGRNSPGMSRAGQVKGLVCCFRGPANACRAQRQMCVLVRERE
jgi:hypothetical protein